MQNNKEINTLLNTFNSLKEDNFNTTSLINFTNTCFNNINKPSINFTNVCTNSMNSYLKIFTNIHTNDIHLFLESINNICINNTNSSLINEYINNIRSSLIDTSNTYKLLFSTLSEIMNDFKKSIISSLSILYETLESVRLNLPFNDFPKTLSNIELWAKYGWVMSDLDNLNLNIFYEEPKSQEEADEIILKYISPDFVDGVLHRLSKLIENKDDSMSFNIIEEAIFCFKNKKYMACISTLLPLFDTELVNIQMKEDKNCNKKIGKRGVQNLEKYFLNKSVPFINYFFQFSIYTYLISLYEKTDNFNTTQYNINRNMILHGMSKRMYTEIDCIKLFNAYTIYKIVTLYFNDLELEIDNPESA